MIVAARLLEDCKRLVSTLENDLRERLSERPELDEPLREEHRRAQARKRTAQSYTVWRDDYLTQVAVHWVLAVVFLRFLEDNGLLPEARLSGSGPRLAQARDRQERFFVQQPAATDRDYLLACFREVQGLPAMKPLFDEDHNPLFKLGPSADGARAILDLFRKTQSDGLIHDFEDPSWNTRFLGDLYQDLSESARKRYALLQTPEFVEEFILDRTLEPAMDELGYQNVTLIDPACGSGHFLLGGFHRIFVRSQKAEPGTNERELARRALDQIAGVDVNPFAVAIARFRLLIAGLKVSRINRLSNAPTYPLNLATGDSLLSGARFGGPTQGNQIPLVGEDPLRHIYATEDAEEARRLLSQQYTVVVANPPYIIPRDLAENLAYRNRFDSCQGKYSLAIPFTERLFDLSESEKLGQFAGWVGIITSNSFMKREFGRKLVEKYVPRWDLTHVIDTSGAYLPGHGTPTVIIIGRNRPPTAPTVRAVMGIRGEPSSPEDPSKGLVWTSILNQVDLPGSKSEFVSVTDLPRVRLHEHPWALTGGGASELLEAIQAARIASLDDKVESIGITSFTLEDDIFLLPWKAAIRLGLQVGHLRPMVTGDLIRDWTIYQGESAVCPYNEKFQVLDLDSNHPIYRYLWRARTSLARGLLFGGKTKIQGGLRWYEFGRLTADKLREPLSIVFAFVATHNHFALDKGGQIFNRTAPVIKLSRDASEYDHLALLGLLNSSLACFWMKQLFFNRGSTTDHRGARQRTLPFEDFWEHDATKLRNYPLPSERPLELAVRLAQRALDSMEGAASKVVEVSVPSREAMDGAGRRVKSHEREMISLQEELDWQVYRLYGLLEDPLEMEPSEIPEINLSERAFEIALARKVAAGEEETQWFARHGSTPITEIPAHWPEPYRQLVEKRLKAIEENPWINLIERPEYKRRWNREPWEEQEKKALRSWLLDRLEDRRYWPEPRVISTGRLADRLRQDDEFRQVASLYRGRDDFDWTELITELALDEAVPFLAAYRYTDSGQRKRQEWEKVWDLQRREDAIDARTKLPAGDPQRLTEDEARATKAREVGEIPVPPRYASTDFRKPAYWRLRGKLDVPKERFILYPGLERGGDNSPVIGWAGWNHLEQAQALGTAFHDLQQDEGWGADRLEPLLAGVLELLPWLLQWHNDPDPAHGGLRLGDYFAGFLDEEARSLGRTREELARWRPVEKAKRGRRKKE